MPRYSFCAALSFSLIVFASGSTEAADGHVSRFQLAQLGLQPLETMSDADGHHIRGQFVDRGVAGSGFFITDANPNALLHNKKSVDEMPGRVVHHSSISKSAIILYHPKFGVKYTGKK